MKKLLLGLLVSILLVTGCTSVTKTGALGIDRQQLMLVSYEKMDKISAEAYVKALKEARDKGKLNIDPILTKRVRDIANRLIAQTGTFRDDALKWKWQVNVVDEDTVNAWCMPGGRIVVYSGIVNKLNLTDAQLAAVMGHEIAHALREHGREQASTNQLVGVGILAIATAAGLGSVGITALGIATQFSIQMPFSRQHETEADRIGTELMARAGYDPKKAVEVWVKMNNTNVGKIPEILSTHPSNESKVKDLREIALKLEPIYLASKNNTYLWDSDKENTLQMIDDFMGRVHNENYSIATTNLISKIVDNIKELVIERYEAIEDSRFYAREFDALEKKLATIKNKRSKEYLETYKETAVQGDRMWKYLAVMLKTTSRIDKLAEALADFTEEARIG